MSNRFAPPLDSLLALLAMLVISVFASTASAQQYAEVVRANQSLANKVCVTCHGGNGKGNPVVGGPRLAEIEPWYLRNQLIGFRAEYRGTQEDYIPGHEMQASVARLSDREIDEVVSTIVTWQGEENDPTITGNANRGSELYQGCAACHGVNGQGNQALAAPGLTRKDDWYLFRQLKLFQSGYRGAHPDDLYGQSMRAGIANIGTEKDINDVLAYINTLD
ncbi:MAG: c-type cytochrome [Pseudohongiellaceae bacterium]|jgi:cytochrome c oxidase subunit 2